MIFVRVKNKKQFQEVLSYPEVSEVIADFGCASLDMERIKEEHPDKKFYLQLPDVLREKKAESVKQILLKSFRFGGLVLKNMDEAGMLKEVLSSEECASAENEDAPALPDLLGDAFLYAYNVSAVAFYRSLFPTMRFLLSDELTDREAEQLIQGAAESGTATASDFIYKVYGYQPLMITNQCLNRNFAGCAKPEMQFSDEKNNRFFITSECGQCYDIIYNGQPTVMLDKTEWKDGGFLVDGFRYENVLLDFTIESEDEMKRILDAFVSGKKEPLPARAERFTRGHHYKGAE